jgi:predicted RNA binding protein YcfA (HicA-like mRNA interferase family)
LKAVSGKHLCKVLARHGWQLKTIRGSHHVYTHPGRDVVLTVPVHGNRDLKSGLLSHLVKQAGLSDVDL